MSGSDMLALLATYSYLLLFPLVLFEGPLAMILAGALSGAGLMSLPVAFAVAVVADLSADSMYYLVGALGRRRSIAKYMERLGVSGQRVDALSERLRAHRGKVLVTAKLTHFAGVPVLIAAGLTGVSFRAFAAYNLLATLPKAALLLLLGYYFGTRAAVLTTYLGSGAQVMIALWAAALSGALIFRYVSGGRNRHA